MTDEELVAEQIPELGLRFLRPSWWQLHRVAGEDEDTWVFWDEHTGTLRMTPFRSAAPTFESDGFLDGMMAEHPGSTSRVFSGRRFVCYAEDGQGETRLHWYITAERDVVLGCSFAYLRELLDDPLSKEEVSGALEDVERVLDSLTIA